MSVLVTTPLTELHKKMVEVAKGFSAVNVVDVEDIINSFV